MNSSTLDDTNDSKNIGYGIIYYIYKELKIDKFWKDIERKENTTLSLEKIFEILVFSRIINPGSKRESFNNSLYKK